MSRHRTVQLLALVLPTLAGCITPPNTDDLSCACEQPDLEGIQQDVDNLAALDIEGRLAALEALGAEDRLSELEARFIQQDVVLAVPAEYPSIQAALAALDGRGIASTATATIQVAPGDYTVDPVIRIQHPNGDRIHITGDADSPADVRLVCPAGCVEVSDGHTLGLIEGMTLVGAGGDYGLVARNNGTLTASAVRTSDFGAGYGALDGGVLFADGTEDEGSWYSYHSGMSAALHADGATSTNPQHYGFIAERSAYMNANNSRVSGAGRDGYLQTGAYLDAEKALATDCDVGFRSNGPGELNVHAARSVNATSYGFTSQYGGLIVLSSRAGEEASAEGSGLVGVMVDGPGLVWVGDYTTISGSGVVDLQAHYGGMIRTESAAFGSMDPSGWADPYDGASIWR